MVLYIILDQDESYSEYIAQSWPDLLIINDRSNFWHFAYAWQFHSDELNDTLKADWCYPNLADNKGPLMEYYALMGDGKMIDGELYEEQRGTDDYLEANPNYSRYLIQFAVIIAAIAPIIIAFPFFQDKMEKGVIQGGVKG